MLPVVAGNYVATLETKLSRQGRETVYTRVYANWDRAGAESSEPLPMRARIAGRVTPSSSQTGGDALEMIELPVKFSTTSTIACCQVSLTINKLRCHDRLTGPILIGEMMSNS